VAGAVSAVDVDGDALTFSISAAPTFGTVVLAASGSFTYTPAVGYSGTDGFVIAVDDGHGGVVAAPVSVTIGGVNDAPTITPIAPQSTNEDTPTAAIPFGVTDEDSPPPTLVVTATSSNPLVAPAGISLEGGGTSRSITLTPLPDGFGTAIITITARDEVGATSSIAFVLTVNPVNDHPDAVDDAAATSEETQVAVNVAANDNGLGDGGIIVEVVGATLDPATEGSAVASGGWIAFTPAQDVTGTVRFDYTIRDADSPASQGTVTVTISGANDAPTIAAIGDVNEVLGVVSTDVGVTVADVDGDDLVVTASASGGSLNVSVVVVGSGGSRTLVVTPDPLATGTTTITVRVSDGLLDDTTTFNYTVAAV
ncbi:MAG TPA: Ig-like domain-containing protein, partial [Acidimicrobiia bacterium]|nr:Ig-like domain-containing protein [Acidimicrobiia bacterium]